MDIQIEKFVSRLNDLLVNQIIEDNLTVKSSVYIVQDTQQTIEFYNNFDLTKCKFGNWLEEKNLLYLMIYGFLQALILQQDALINICIAFKVSTKNRIRDNYVFKEIREVRNSSIGHPANRKDHSKNFISQTSVSQFYFEYLKVNNTIFEIKKVNLKYLADKQNIEIHKLINKIEKKLDEF